jgi:pimeloyl-ACP methyl ester carboxylesterase
MSSLTSSSMLMRRIISSTSISRRFFGKTTTIEISPTTALLGSSPIKLHTEFLAATKNSSTTNTDDDDKEQGNDNNDNNEYTILFLHGLLGNGRNLKTFARNVVKQQSSSSSSSSSSKNGCRGGILMDLRGHGKSYQTQKQDNDNDNDNDNDTYATISTFQDCTQDIDYTLKEFHKNTIKAEAPTSVIVGHSFGGRLALEYAAANAVSKSTSTSLKAVWLLDTVPGEANDSVDHVLGIITDVIHNTSISSRGEEKSLNQKEIVDILTQEPYKMDLGTAQWLAMSYDSQNNDFGFDNDLVTRLKPEFSNQDFMGMLRTILENNNNNNNNSDSDTHVHLVRGGKNTGWTIPIISKFEALTKEFPSTFHLHVLHKSGHNVHVDDMHGLVKLFSGT